MSQCIFYDRCNHKDCELRPNCLRETKLGTLYKLAGFSEKQSRKLVLNIDRDGTDLQEFTKLARIEENIVAFVNDPLHNNLYLHSYTCGNGKSSWATRLLQKYLSKVWYNSELTPRALFVSVPTFLDSLKLNIDGYDPYSKMVTKYAFNADIVVWDDIAAKRLSDYEITKLMSLIEARLIAGKANIFTSNLSTEDMYDAIGSRLASRICNGSIDIELHGADKRNTNFKELN